MNKSERYQFHDNSVYWFANGRVHREDGPAIEWTNGTKYWYKDGKSHREDGPSIIYPNGEKYWRINKKIYLELEYKNWFRMNYEK